VNILFFTAVAAARYGGPVAWTRRLAETLRDLGHRVFVLTWGPAEAGVLVDHEGRPSLPWGPDAHQVPLTEAARRVPFLGFWGTMASTARAGRRLLDREEIDVIHTLNVYEAFSASLARGGGRQALVLTLHGDYVTEQNERWKNRWRRRLHLPLEQAGLRACQAVTTSSAWLRDRLEQPLRGRRVEIIPNGIAVPSRDRVPTGRADLGLPEGRRIVLCLNSLYAPYRRRGLELLIQAAPRVLERVPDVLFVVAGGVNDPRRDGELVAWARQQAAGLPFHFTGYRRRPPQDLMEVADLYVHPSFLDNSPTAVLEAMALAKPIVATRIGGIPELIADGETGLLSRPEPPALADALVRLLSDRHLAQALGTQARRAAVHTFSWTTVGERFVELYRELAGRPPRSP